MSRYKNITTLLDTAENYDLERLVKLLSDDEISYEDLAEDVAFVLISLWGLIPEEKRLDFKERLTDEIVNVEIKEMFGYE